MLSPPAPLIFIVAFSVFFFSFFSRFCFEQFNNSYSIIRSSVADETQCDTYLIGFQSLSLSQTLVIITSPVWTWPLTLSMSCRRTDTQLMNSQIGTFWHFGVRLKPPPPPLWQPTYVRDLCAVQLLNAKQEQNTTFTKHTSRILFLPPFRMRD